ncbi:protein crumbs-like isoform X2 [Magallana gigas]|uniref:protein crumbs-like isoform X2 n=1 Tax=Magallana gigas TaxID=29159 RepID=UPI003342660C
MYIWPTLTFFALIPCVLSSHFRGGLLTWKAVNETQILVSHRVSYVFSYCSNPETATLQCFSGCTGSVIMNANCTESNSTENWADFEGVTKFDITNQTTFVFLRFFSSAWMSLAHSASSWSLLMTVDLSIRSDTGKINQSPVSSVASSMIFSRACWNSVGIPYIPVADFDGDNVGCRFASGPDECASICGNHLSFLTLNEATCSFTVNSNLSSTADGDYAVALQIEDFADSSSSIPISSVPLQFIITVKYGVFCFDAPRFVSPTPAAGETLQAQNRSLQLNARAFIVHSKVTQFHIMSPLNFTMSDIVQGGANDYEVTMSLDSNTEDLNGTYVMCFSAETNERISSESRCITVDLGDTDDCASQPCQNNGTCIDLINDYQCNCIDGFNGTNCTNNIDDCQAEPCQNNGTCTDLVNDYQCSCVAGFNGTNCENNINECAVQPCKNNGTCIDLINGYQCICAYRFNGTNCETSNDSCPSDCQNNSTCIDIFSHIHCQCVEGFNGTRCENNIDDCIPEPCQNNGTCTDLVNDYHCDCVAGFNETNCENNIDDCQPDPCQNNGTCTDLVNDYHCDCVAGFNGTNCENNINDCQAEPCQNNGTCTDLVNDYRCDCVAGFNETNCDNNINDCLPNPCQNNGTCTDMVNDYKCDCVPGFNGTNCENGNNY